MGTPDHLTCPLRNFYAGQETAVRTGCGKNRLVQNWEKRTSRLYIATCLFNLYTEYLIQNPGLDKVQAEINIARRNSNNLRHGVDTTLMAESARNLPLDEGQRGG